MGLEERSSPLLGGRVWCLLLLREFSSASTDAALLIFTLCRAAAAASLAFQDAGVSKIVWFATRSSLLPQAAGLQARAYSLAMHSLSR